MENEIMNTEFERTDIPTVGQLISALERMPRNLPVKIATKIHKYAPLPGQRISAEVSNLDGAHYHEEEVGAKVREAFQGMPEECSFIWLDIVGTPTDVALGSFKLEYKTFDGQERTKQEAELPCVILGSF